MTKELDKKDWHILRHLCENARMSKSRLSKEVGLSKNAAEYRVERLKKMGIISSFFLTYSSPKLGYNEWEVLMKVTGDEKDFIEFVKNNDNVTVCDKLSGEWDYFIEFSCKSIEEFQRKLGEVLFKFSNIIESYEVHTILDFYKVEQLPVELLEDHRDMEKPLKLTENFSIDKTDKKLLYELSKDSSKSLVELSKSFKLTPEAIAIRIKKLKQSGIIRSFTPQINLNKLGYDVFLICFDLRCISKTNQEDLKKFFVTSKVVRFAFLSGTVPRVFAYIAAKKTMDVDTFIKSFKSIFKDILVREYYMIGSYQLKYDIVPKAIIHS